ncbi:MAG: hypothetical protein ACLQOZ_12680 [Acidimicrobiales bacterium]
MDSLLRYIQKIGFRRGVRGQHPIWFIVAASAWMLIRARRSREAVVYRTVLQPGEGLIVETARSHGPGSDSR